MILSETDAVAAPVVVVIPFSSLLSPCFIISSFLFDLSLVSTKSRVQLLSFPVNPPVYNLNCLCLGVNCPSLLIQTFFSYSYLYYSGKTLVPFFLKKIIHLFVFPGNDNTIKMLSIAFHHIKHVQDISCIFFVFFLRHLKSS